jgi:hypothetical protein
MRPAILRSLFFCATAALVISGCASNSSESSHGTAAEPRVSYQQTLRTCRKLQPGRLNQRLNLPPQSIRVAACLRKRGWQPDGTPYTEP